MCCAPTMRLLTPLAMREVHFIHYTVFKILENLRQAFLPQEAEAISSPLRATSDLQG